MCITSITSQASKAPPKPLPAVILHLTSLETITTKQSNKLLSCGKFGRLNSVQRVELSDSDAFLTGGNSNTT